MFQHQRNLPMLSFAEIGRTLTGRQPKLLPPGVRTQAAVAMILRERSGRPEVLFIERAQRDGDPWSGDLGFPGGKVEKGDGGLRETAERETWEETGLSLEKADCLGRLDDIAGDHLPVQIACLVYGVERIPELTFSEEVADAFWFPLPELLNPERRVQTAVRFRHEVLLRPGIDLLGPGRPVLWGITYRLVGQFLEIFGFDPGDTDPGRDFL